jgi:alkylated DNA repair protein (DNA oxidative demethylase)
MLQGFLLFPDYLAPEVQRELVETVSAGARLAPFVRQETPGGARMSVAMTGFGARVWRSDRSGYRYAETQGETGAPWPPMPARLIELWRTILGRTDAPDSCLVNHYGEGARMGLHQDRDEKDLTAPVLSLSLGDTAIFRLGGLSRSARTTSLRLASGDVMALTGEARLAFHGVDRIIFGSSRLVPGGGRINLTLRKAA